MQIAADRPLADHSTVIRRGDAGALRGRCKDGICRFLGVPYAAPPVGANRFREPRPVTPWEGERDATQPGDCAPHRLKDFPAIDVEPLVGRGGEGGEDYLTLNIWAPEKAAALPVMVFIHGGGFVIGCKDSPVNDGTEFAKSGIVCVAINYRLGIDGFLPIPGVPTNLGLRDMLFALEWVRRNIAEFGGDPSNVTVFGESAGAMAIADLVSSPVATGLFRRAIIESGHGGMVRDIPVAHRLVRKLAKYLKIPPTEAGFRSVSFDRSWKAMEKVTQPLRIDLRDETGFEPVFGISRFIPVWGDDILPEKPHQALKRGAGKDIDVLIGTNEEEMNLYFVPTKVRAKFPGFLLRWLLGKSLPKAIRALEAYGWREPGARPGHVFTKAMTDLVFRWPARRFAEEHQGKTYMYDFDWKSPACGGELGACHGIEMPFVFKTLSTATGPRGFAGEAPPQDLADYVHNLWVQFATDGTLPWPEFNRESRQVHLLGSNKTISEPVMPAAAFLS